MTLELHNHIYGYVLYPNRMAKGQNNQNLTRLLHSRPLIHFILGECKLITFFRKLKQLWPVLSSSYIISKLKLIHLVVDD